MTETSQIACFSGYRPEKFTAHMERDDQFFHKLWADVCQAVIKAVDDGHTVFLCGMARGFDLLAGSVVLGLKGERPDWAHVRLIAVLPFANLGDSWKGNFDYKIVLDQADEVITLAPKYHPKAYHDRNRYMVDRSSRLICFYDGQPGGTKFTVRYAERCGLEICNLATLGNEED